MSIDRAKLEEAIGILRRWWCHGMAERFDALDKIYINRVCEAAEAHANTLPRFKTVWHVTDGEGSVHYDTADEAYRAAWPRMQLGISDVTIGSRKVPA